MAPCGGTALHGSRGLSLRLPRCCPRPTSVELRPRLRSVRSSCRPPACRYDVDGSGGIDVGEFALLVQDLCVPMSRPRLQKAFEELDSEGSGQVSFERFEAWINQSGGRARSRNKLGALRLAIRKSWRARSGRTDKLRVQRAMALADSTPRAFRLKQSFLTFAERRKHKCVTAAEIESLARHLGWNWDRDATVKALVFLGRQAGLTIGFGDVLKLAAQPWHRAMQARGGSEDHASWPKGSLADGNVGNDVQGAVEAIDAGGSGSLDEDERRRQLLASEG